MSLPDHLNLGVKSTASQVKLCIPDVDVSPWQTICSFSLQAGTQGWGNKTNELIFLRTAELLFTDVLWPFLISVKILSCRKQNARTFSMLLVLFLVSFFTFGNIGWRKKPKLMVSNHNIWFWIQNEKNYETLWAWFVLVICGYLENKIFCLKRLTTTTLYLVNAPDVPTS